MPFDSAIRSLRAGNPLGGVGERVQSVLEHRFEFGEIGFSLSGVITALVALLGIWLLSRLVQKGFTRYAKTHPEELRPAIYTVSRLAKYALIVVGVLVALGLLGIPLTSFAVLAGAIGVGLGFGLQAIFSNFISGLILLFDRSLKVGDFIEIGSDLQGTVRDIGIRATRIITNDNIDILVPNSEFVTGRVVNWTMGSGISRMRVSFGVDYDVDKDKVKEAALEAAAAVPFTLTLEGEHAPEVWLVEFAESTVNFELVVWLTAQGTKLPDEAKAAYRWALDDALRRHGIAIPFPTTDLNIRSLFGLEGDDALRALNGKLAPNDVWASSAETDAATDRAGDAPRSRPTGDSTK